MISESMTHPSESHVPRLALTPGEPAGIGPDLIVRLAAAGHSAADLVAIAGRQLD